MEIYPHPASFGVRELQQLERRGAILSSSGVGIAFYIDASESRKEIREVLHIQAKLPCVDDATKL